MRMIAPPIAVIIALTLSLVVCVAVWVRTHHERPDQWVVDPPASAIALAGSGLGDRQLAYRLNVTRLQMFGDTGGRATPLAEYPADKLIAWFFLLSDLDPLSLYVPYLAGFYYSGDPDPAKALRIAYFLGYSGLTQGGDGWRSVMNAYYLAKHVRHHDDWASFFAYQVQDMAGDIPDWARLLSAVDLQRRGYMAQSASRLEVMLRLRRAGTLAATNLPFVLQTVCPIIHAGYGVLNVYCRFLERERT